MKFSIYCFLPFATTEAFVSPLHKEFRGNSQNVLAATVSDEEATKPEAPLYAINPFHRIETDIDTLDDSLKPGRTENEKFRCDESVEFWKTFRSLGNAKNLDRARSIIAKHVLSESSNDESRAYWLSHVLRTSYFVTNAVAGLVGHDLYERFLSDKPRNDVSSSNSRLSLFLKTDAGTRLIAEAMLCYEQDHKQVQKGRLRFPWDAILYNKNSNRFQIQATHLQLNPFFALSETSRVVREAIGIYRRQNRYKGKPSTEGVWMMQGRREHGLSSLPASTLQYPSYYLNDFHYQNDGWLSTESAETYEVSTETLFLGRQDAMQRQTLLPIKSHFGNQDPKTLLEVACGTGRFATFTRDNFRSTLVTLTDLSPFYLEKARRNDAYWRTYQSLDVAPARCVQANAESLPFEDESFEAVTCVYLFHELPEEARVQAASEMARVVKRGGIVVITDSFQLGDRPPIDANIGGFSTLNEPHFQNYIRTAIAPLFERHGLVCHEKYFASSSKTLSFLKPK